MTPVALLVPVAPDDPRRVIGEVGTDRQLRFLPYALRTAVAAALARVTRIDRLCGSRGKDRSVRCHQPLRVDRSAFGIYTPSTETRSRRPSPT